MRVRCRGQCFYVLVALCAVVYGEDDSTNTQSDSYFDKVYVLNLDRRPDRWRQTSLELKRSGVDAERMSAIDGLLLSSDEIQRFNVSARGARGRKILPGQVGCALSHMKVMEHARIEDDVRSILVLEDDVTLVPNFRQHLDSTLEALPSDWEIFFLGASGCVLDEDEDRSADVKSIVMRATNCWTTHAYAVNGKNAIEKIFYAQRERLLPADSLLVELQKEMLAYAARPALAYQRVGPSDIALFNRGHLGLRVPLDSSNDDAALFSLWASTSTGAPLRLPLVAFNAIALQLLSFADRSENDDVVSRSIRTLALNYALPSSSSHESKDACRHEACDRNVSVSSRFNVGFYWKRFFEASVRWSPLPWSSDANVLTFETEEAYYAHRKAHHWPLDWSMIATVLESRGMWGANPAIPQNMRDASLFATDDKETAGLILQTLLALSLLAERPSSIDSSSSCPEGSVPLRFLRRLRSANDAAWIVDVVPSLIRLRLVGYARPRSACNDDGIGIVVSPAINASRMVRTAIAQLSKSDRRRLRRWRLMAVASNVPSASAFVPSLDGTPHRVRWPSMRRELMRLFDAALAASDSVEDPRNIAIAAALLLRVHALALTDERFSVATKLANRAETLVSLLPRSAAYARRLRVRALRRLSLSFQASKDASDEDKGADAFARLLETADDVDRLAFSDADRAGLAAEAGLLLHARGMHAHATRQFVASTSYVDRIDTGALWRRIGALASFRTLTASPQVRYWRYLDTSSRAETRDQCEKIAQSRNAAIYLVGYGINVSPSCAIVVPEDVVTFALEFDLASVAGQTNGATSEATNYFVYKRITPLERADARLAIAEIGAAIGAVRLWQGRLDAAGSLLVDSTRAMQDILQNHNEPLSRAEECHPLFGRAYANYVLWNGLVTTSDASTSTANDLRVCVDILRCAFASSANWREAQIHADLSQLHALDGDRDRSMAHIRASIDMYDRLLADAVVRDHPLRVRAQLLNDAVRDIFDESKSDGFRRGVSSASSADITIDIRVDDVVHQFRVRTGENVSALALAFTESHGLESSNAILLRRRVYQRRAAFLSAYGGPSAKYEM